MKHFFQAPVLPVSHQSRAKQSFYISVSRSEEVVERLTRVSVTQCWGVACNCGFPAFCPVVPFPGHCHLWLVSLPNAAADWAPFPLALNGHNEAIGPSNYTAVNPVISLSSSPVLISSCSLPHVASISQS